jgi:hypothetical protein
MGWDSIHAVLTSNGVARDCEAGARSHREYWLTREFQAAQPDRATMRHDPGATVALRERALVVPQGHGGSEAVAGPSLRAARPRGFYSDPRH